MWACCMVRVDLRGARANSPRARFRFREEQVLLWRKRPRQLVQQLGCVSWLVQNGGDQVLRATFKFVFVFKGDGDGDGIENEDCEVDACGKGDPVVYSVLR